MASLSTSPVGRSATTTPAVPLATPGQFSQILMDARSANLTVAFTSPRGRRVELNRTALTRLALMEDKQVEFQRTYGVSPEVVFGALREAVQRGESSTAVDPFPAPPREESKPEPVVERAAEPVVELPSRRATSVVQAPANQPRLPAPETAARRAPTARSLTSHIVFIRLTDEVRAAIEQAITDDPGLIPHFHSLAKHYAVGSQSIHTRDAMFQQLLRWPNADQVSAMQRLAEAGWFGQLTLADRFRAVRLIAYASSVAHDSTDRIQKGLLNESLDRVLGPTPDYDIYFESLEGPELANAKPRCDCSRDDERTDSLNLDRLEVASERGPLEPNERRAMQLALEALPHEVSHLVNRDRASGDFQNFRIEYDSEFVALHARYGRPPTRREMYKFAQVLLVGDGYSWLAKLRKSVDDRGVPTAEAQKVTRFMNQFFDPPFPVDEPLTDEDLPKDHQPPNANDTAPAPGPRIMYDALLRSAEGVGV